MIYIYGRSRPKGYRIYIIAPKAEVLSNPRIAQLIQDLGVRVLESWPKEIPITVTRNEKTTEVEEKIIEIGHLIHEEWIKAAK